jgi:predicted DNA binding CopG/RHH family protein
MSEPRLKVKPRPGQSATGSRTPSDLAPLTALAAEEPTARLNVQIPAKLRQQLKIRAVQEGRTVQDLVKQLLHEYLNRS